MLKGADKIPYDIFRAMKVRWAFNAINQEEDESVCNEDYT